ncbi:hypothetical protein TI39_contig4268g00017 [Zymoseptoria brevis]|uniref:Uncharacterized protein n=1 Tax=Zymoseptoria brevis TaxID=1047168 RepID=A0A0F4G8N4_9PEZI|nr:hypothetical protein TI39_contig4268g00017 [Zymoseptoria brevis]
MNGPASVAGRQAAACGFLVTAVELCPPGCIASVIAGIFGAAVTCRDPITTTATPTSALGTSAAPANTVTSTKRITIVPTDASSTRPTSSAQASSTGSLSEASDPSSTSSPAPTSAPTSTPSSSPTPTPTPAAVGGSKSFAQTTGGILTITLLTLGILGAIVVGIFFWRRRRRQRQEKEAADRAAEANAPPRFTSRPYMPSVVDLSETLEDSRVQPEPEMKEQRDVIKSPQPSRSSAAPSPMLPPNPYLDYKRYSTATPDFDRFQEPSVNERSLGAAALPPGSNLDRTRYSPVPRPASTRASSIYSEAPNDPGPDVVDSFLADLANQGASPRTPSMSHGERMAQLQREHEARGGYGVPEISPEARRRPKVSLSEYVNREARKLDERTDRWDPDAPRGVPPIPERSTRRPRPDDGAISRKPVG